MGTDARTYLLKKHDDSKYYLADDNEPRHLFSDRYYRIYAFIGGVRNTFDVPSISFCVPYDANDKSNLSEYSDEVKNFFDDFCDNMFLEVNELINFNYDDEFEYKGEKITYRDFLSWCGDEHYFFNELKRLKDFMADKDPKEFRLIMVFDY